MNHRDIKFNSLLSRYVLSLCEICALSLKLPETTFYIYLSSNLAKVLCIVFFVVSFSCSYHVFKLQHSKLFQHHFHLNRNVKHSIMHVNIRYTLNTLGSIDFAGCYMQPWDYRVLVRHIKKFSHWNGWHNMWSHLWHINFFRKCIVISIFSDYFMHSLSLRRRHSLRKWNGIWLP